MRDKYLCQKCLNAPAEEVHHIIPLTPININNPEISLSEKNLVSLCKDCHFKEHGNKKLDVKEGYRFDSKGYLIKE